MLVLAVIGGLTALYYAMDLISGIYAHFLRGGKNLKKSYGQWAVVTGATDGIGKAMAFELARKGLNIVLISRSQDKLEACENELKAKYASVEVKIKSVDYSAFDEPTRKSLAGFLSGLDIGVLINNVGISYPYTKYFHELDDERVAQLMSLNVDSTTWMTRIVIPGMVERKRGAIVNIGSAAGVSNSPLLAQYGAAKSYIAMFSRAMNKEYAGLGVHVQCQVPMFVTTKLAKLRKTSLFVASPEAYARAAVASIGYDALISPYWSHALQIWALTNLPESLMAKVTMDMHKGIRKAGMKKEGLTDTSSSSSAKKSK